MNTFLTALPLLSDTELISQAVARVLLGDHSERRWSRPLHGNAVWRGMFPYLS